MPDTVEFDENRAYTCYPIPTPKLAPRLKVPRTADGTAIPVAILPSWGGAQVFQDDFYLVTKDGQVKHGASARQWESMYSEVVPGMGFWVKTSPPIGYVADEAGTVATYVNTPLGRVLESSLPVKPGDRIIRQADGEVQRVSAATYPTLYFSDEDAAALKLHDMTTGEFAQWALVQARTALLSQFSASAVFAGSSD